jgi:hypothetical protein
MLRIVRMVNHVLLSAALRDPSSCIRAPLANRLGLLAVGTQRRYIWFPVAGERPSSQVYNPVLASRSALRETMHAACLAFPAAAV